MAKTRADRYCTICGEHYLYCRCQEYDHMEPWHDAYCSANCKDLYNITAGYLNGWMEKEVEIARLEKADLSKIDSFPQWMQDTIKEMKNYKKESDVPVEAINQVLNEKIDVSENDEVVEEEIKEHSDDKVEVHQSEFKRNKPKYKK